MKRIVLLLLCSVVVCSNCFGADFTVDEIKVLKDVAEVEILTDELEVLQTERATIVTEMEAEIEAEGEKFIAFQETTHLTYDPLLEAKDAEILEKENQIGNVGIAVTTP